MAKVSWMLVDYHCKLVNINNNTATGVQNFCILHLKYHVYSYIKLLHDDNNIVKPATRDWPLMRDHWCSNIALHFYTFVPVMKAPLAHKTPFYFCKNNKNKLFFFFKDTFFFSFFFFFLIARHVYDILISYR